MYVDDVEKVQGIVRPRHRHHCVCVWEWSSELCEKRERNKTTNGTGGGSQNIDTHAVVMKKKELLNRYEHKDQTHSTLPHWNTHCNDHVGHKGGHDEMLRGSNEFPT